MLARVINTAAFTVTLTAAAAGSPSSTATVPYSYVDNRMMVGCKIDGRGPFYMIVDTGAPDITITPETARRIGAVVVANGTMTGAGNRQVRMGSTTITTLSIGSIDLSDFGASVVDLSEIRTKLGFPRLDGVIGYPIFKRFSTFVNVDAGTISFAAMPPRTPPFATTTPLTGTIPTIAGSIDGISTQIIVDTGDRSSLTLFGPFAKTHGFYGRYPSRTNIVTGYGIGGPIRGDVFTIPSLDVLGRHLRGIVARASRQTGGVFTSTDQGGSIGTGVLKRFNVVYDYADKRIIAWPSKYFRSPDRFSPPGALAQ
jgi:predicted aspartyl protease